MMGSRKRQAGMAADRKQRLREQGEDMAELTSMMNIGKEMAKKLESVGIGSAEELARLGAEQAFLKEIGRAHV